MSKNTCGSRFITTFNLPTNSNIKKYADYSRVYSIPNGWTATEDGACAIASQNVGSPSYTQMKVYVNNVLISHNGNYGNNNSGWGGTGVFPLKKRQTVRWDLYSGQITISYFFPLSSSEGRTKDIIKY